MQDCRPPQVYQEYLLKKTFGWTQAELEQETDVDLYLYIMAQENQRQKMENNK
jgi:hypothetical protein